MARVRPTTWGQSIKAARLAAGLTAEQLGARLGRSTSALSRWEVDRTRPPPRQQQALLREISALNRAAGEALKAVLAPPPLAAPPPPAPVIDVAREVERALFAFADELDVPARRARGALVKLHRRLREAKVELGQAEARLEEWVRADAASSE